MKVIGKGSVVKVVCNHCDNCMVEFINNINISITDLTIVQSQPRNNPASIEGCHFSLQFWNAVTLLENFHTHSSAISVFNSGSFTIQGNSTFIGCSSIAILSYNSSIILSGEVAFVNNTGTAGAAVSLVLSDLRVAADANIVFINNSVTIGGGALYLYLIRQIHIDSGVNLTFINNSADSKGGAVYIRPDLEVLSESNKMFVSSTLRLLVPICSFQSPNCSNTSIHISFSNNFAEAGDDIYGTSLQACLFFRISSCYSIELGSRTSSFSSDPLRVCLCDSHGTPQCTNSQFIYNISRQVYPGEDFTRSHCGI